MKRLEGPPFEITEEAPTPIVKDFETFLEAVEAPSAHLSKAKQTLDRKTAHSLNRAMLTHRTETHPRTDQEYYALLNLFQRICISARLHVIDREKSKLQMAPTEAVAQFRRLTPTEKFVALLEGLWVDCDWEELVPGRRGGDQAFTAELVVSALNALPVGEWIDRGDRRREARALVDDRYGCVARSLSFFGFVECEVRDASRDYMLKGAIEIQRLRVTNLGGAFLGVLCKERRLGAWNAAVLAEHGGMPSPFFSLLLETEEEDEAEAAGSEAEPCPSEEDEGGTGQEPFFRAFVPLVPEGTLTHGLPRQPRAVREGTYVFRVSLSGRCWRTIALGHEHVLGDLHLAIQDAFRFDNDHLYAFFMDGKRWSRKSYNDARGDHPPFADEAVLGELDLFVRQRILYLFDLGDEWTFNVDLLEVREEPFEGRPKILERHGKSPEQYPR